jgi:hypothetical protein
LQPFYQKAVLSLPVFTLGQLTGFDDARIFGGCNHGGILAKLRAVNPNKLAGPGWIAAQ